MPSSRGISLTQGSNLCLLQLLHFRLILYHGTTGKAHICQSQSPYSSQSPSCLRIHTFVLYVYLYFCFANKTIYNIFLDSTYMLVQWVKNLPAMEETWVRSLDWKDPLEEGMETLSNILA